MKSLRNPLVLSLGVACVALAVRADDDQSVARKALRAGQIVSLEKILAAAEDNFSGQIVEVELEREEGRWEYEIELLTREGNVIELIYDAATARLLRTEGSGVEAARKKARPTP